LFGNNEELKEDQPERGRRSRRRGLAAVEK
jgi:hypothetical protein